MMTKKLNPAKMELAFQENLRVFLIIASSYHLKNLYVVCIGKQYKQFIRTYHILHHLYSLYQSSGLYYTTFSLKFINQTFSDILLFRLRKKVEISKYPLENF